MLINMMNFRSDKPKIQGVSATGYSLANVSITDITPVLMTSVNGKAEIFDIDISPTIMATAYTTAQIDIIAAP